MAFRRWNPYGEFDVLRREMERMFNLLGSDDDRMPLFRTSFLPGRSARAYPLVNVSEDADALYVEALAPGVDPQSLNITLTRNQLTVSGEKQDLQPNVKPEAFHRNERSTGKFVRTIALPVDVDESKIQANYQNGLLLITMPKSEKAKPREIAVKVG